MLPLKMDTVHRSSIFNLQFQSTLYGKILRFWDNFKTRFHRTYSTRQLPLIWKVIPLHSFKVSWKYLQSCRNSLWSLPSLNERDFRLGWIFVSKHWKSNHYIFQNWLYYNLVSFYFLSWDFTPSLLGCHTVNASIFVPFCKLYWQHELPS